MGAHCDLACDRGYRAVQGTCAPAIASLLAGSLGGAGSADGTGQSARFDQPWGIALDGAGNAYVADSQNYTIRKITPGGVVTTLAGAPKQLGSTDAASSSARFSIVTGLGIDASGNLYVADSYNETIRKVTPSGQVTTLAGLAGQPGANDGVGSAARFFYPDGVAVDAAGSVYVADKWNATIRKIDSNGVVTTLAGSAQQRGHVDGIASAASFLAPKGIAVDTSGTAFVVDDDQVRAITATGVVTTPWHFTVYPGHGIAADAAGNVYAAEYETIGKVTSAGDWTTLAGVVLHPGSTDGKGAAARFSDPNGLAVDTAGNVYVADTANNTIRVVGVGGVVTTLAGLTGRSGSVDAAGPAATFSAPEGVAADATGSVYVVDRESHTVRKVTPDGDVTTLAGTAGEAGSKDGIGSAARFYSPGGVAVDLSGNAYIADTANQTIRKLTPSGDVVTVAGVAGQAGSTDGVGSAARFHNPSAIAVDRSGSVYVADTYNNTIRKLTPDGQVSTLAGVAGQAGSDDGRGPAARFSYPDGVAVDGSGNVFVADWRNHTIRAITPDGTVTTLAGVAGEPGEVDGAGTAARFDAPRGIAVDAAGEIFVADAGGSTLRQIRPSGAVTTIAGVAGQAGVNLTSVPIGLNAPRGIATTPSGALIVADGREHSLLTLRW